MKLRKILALALALVISASSFAACAPAGGNEESGKPETENTAMYPGTSEEGAVTLNLGTEPPELNTLTATYSMAFTVLGNLYEGLMELDENDKPVPGAAESYEVSEDGLHYTFKLRDGLKWTNGEPVTAKDFTYAWEKLITPATGSEYAYFAFFMKNAEKFYNGECGIEDVGFKAVDDKTLEVELENPTAYALSLFSFGALLPVNQKFYEEVGGDKYMTEAEYFCTNGPFKMTSWTHESNIVLDKNTDYYRADDVDINKITYVMLNTADTAMNSFKAGEVDMIGLTGDQAKQMKEEGYPVQSYSDGSEFHILMNCNDKYLSNKNLRKAIDLAYSRTNYISAILKDESLPAESFTNPGVKCNDKPFADTVKEKLGVLNAPDANVEEAKKYLDTALKELNCTVEDLNKHLSMNCGDSDIATQQAAFFQEQLRTNLGLEIEIKSMTTKAQSQERVNRNYVMDFTGWGPDYNDPMTFLNMWVTGSGNNSVDWSNERYDELIDLASKEMDPVKREEYFIECEKILNEEVPISCTYWRIKSYVTSGKIDSGYIRSTFQDMNFAFAKLK